MSRIAVIRNEDCHPDKCGNYLCIRLCPVNRTGVECIVKGDDGKAKIIENLCTGCGICPKRCPFGAISIVNLPKELEHQPIHRYGPNGFILFSLPAPIQGKVLGIIGKNAIGKSTAIKLLAGVLKPNLGSELEADFAEVLQYFKGTQAQNLFEAIARGQITVSFKPQQIDLIPKAYTGTVRGLLARVPNPVQFDETIKSLDIVNILDNDLAELSGGELQRVAIAASSIKKADLYIFDEPTSYLDIKQRISLAEFLNNLASRASVMAIEHDLIALDYMADFVQIMYGMEGVYGIVSNTRAVRTGINVYLSGYMKDENMRFRDHAINFSRAPGQKHESKEELISWSRLSKKLGHFNLHVDEGKLHRGLICGILGENAIGKTTFVRMLAGEINPDFGEISGNLKVSYKPQYLTVQADMLVNQLLSEVHNHQALVTGLQLKNLMEKQLSWLSGGELQRVAIAYCMSRKAELYLLDEPSAYLDVEQRLALAKILRDFAFTTGKTIIVVDHDLLFLDAISDKLMVFDGKPSIEGHTSDAMNVEHGMNLFLSRLEISMRRDEETKRPRINKAGSRKDREQKDSGNLYYS